MSGHTTLPPMDGTPEALKASGGIYHFEVEVPDVDQPQGWVNVMGVELPTQSSREQIDELKTDLLITNMSALALRTMAECYALRQPLLIESDPSVGKSFLFEKFLRLLNANEDPLTIGGTPRTSDHEVTGHYSPGEQGWRFVKGAIPEAATAHDGSGRPLFIDEFGSIPSNYQQLFLPISGQDGSLASSIGIWGNGNEHHYPVGRNTWFGFATNFPERTLGRHVVTDAMASRVVWLAIDDNQAAANEKSLIKAGFGRSITTPTSVADIATPEQTRFDWSANPQLAELIADAVSEIHGKVKNRAKSPGDSLGTGEDAEPRMQQVFITPRDAARLFNYIERFPIIDTDRGKVDIVRTLSRAFERHYANRFASPDQRRNIMNDVKESLSGETSGGRSTKPRSEQFLEAQKKSVKSESSTVDKQSDSAGTSEQMSTVERQRMVAEAQKLSALIAEREQLLADHTAGKI